MRKIFMASIFGCLLFNAKGINDYGPFKKLHNHDLKRANLLYEQSNKSVLRKLASYCGSDMFLDLFYNKGYREKGVTPKQKTVINSIKAKKENQSLFVDLFYRKRKADITSTRKVYSNRVNEKSYDDNEGSFYKNLPPAVPSRTFDENELDEDFTSDILSTDKGEFIGDFVFRELLRDMSGTSAVSLNIFGKNKSSNCAKRITSSNLNITPIKKMFAKNKSEMPNVLSIVQMLRTIKNHTKEIPLNFGENIKLSQKNAYEKTFPDNRN